MPFGIHRRTRILAAVIILVTGVLIAWLVVPRREPKHSVVSRLTSMRTGRHGELHVDRIAIVSVTNTSRVYIWLEQPSVECGYQDGRVVGKLAHKWNGRDYSVLLIPNSVAELPIGLSNDVKRFRVAFVYSRDGGRVRRAIGGAVQKLPAKFLPGNVETWLSKNGLLDGDFFDFYKSPWMPSPLEKNVERTAQ